MPSRAERPQRLVRSKQRVADHGEVFTPAWLVADMLDLVEAETRRIDSRFLDPACGSGNFLVPVLERKLHVVRQRYGHSVLERRHRALEALMCVYGIELLSDNVAECRANLLETWSLALRAASGDAWSAAATTVVGLNVVHGDALQATDASGAPITFAEWSYTGSGIFLRRDFRYHDLARHAPRRETRRGTPRGTRHEAQRETPSDSFEEPAITPTRVFAPLTVHDIPTADGSADRR